MANEVYVGSEVTVNVLSPIDGSTLDTIPYAKKVTATSKTQYADRKAHRSAGMAAYEIRRAGTVTISGEVDSFTHRSIIDAWSRYGVQYWPLASDLRGRDYRGVLLQMAFANAATGQSEQVRAVNCVMSDHALGRSQFDPVSQDLTLEAQGGINGDESEPYAHFKDLSIFRTGSKTYINTAGTLSTAADGQPAFGLPYVVRRNLINSDTTGWNHGASTYALNQATGPFNGTFASKLVEDTSNGNHMAYLNGSGGGAVTPTLVSGSTYTISICAKAAERSMIWFDLADGADHEVWFNLATGSVGTTQAGLTGATITSLGGGWYRCSVTRTVAQTTMFIGVGMATTDNVLGYAGNGTSGLYLFGAQLEQAGSASPVQIVTNGSVDLSSPLSGAGLVHEGLGTNLCPNNTWTGGNPLYNWYNNAGTQAGLSAVASIYPFGGKTNALQYAFGGQWDAFVPQGFSLAANTTYTISCYMKSSTTQQYAFEWPNGTSHYALTLQAGVVTPVSFTVTIDSTGGYSSIIIKNYQAGTPTLTVDAFQIEANPFQTSLILTSNGPVTRSPDLCALTVPHNLLTYSQDFTNAAWSQTNGPITITGAQSDPMSGSAAQQLTFDTNIKWLTNRWNTSGLSTASNAIQATLTSNWQRFYVSSNGYVFSVWMKAGTAGSINIRCGTDGSGAYVQITSSATNGAGNSATGTVYAWGAQLEQASIPGAYIATYGQALPKQLDATEWPNWLTQNGSLTVSFVQPVGANVAAGTRILGSVAGLSISQFGSTISLTRKSNGGSRSVSITLNTADGSNHTATATWGNYTNSNGVRSMPLTLTVDSTTATIDAAALYGDTLWVADERLWLSDGNAFATISNLKIGRLTLPVGAVAAA